MMNWKVKAMYVLGFVGVIASLAGAFIFNVGFGIFILGVYVSLVSKQFADIFMVSGLSNDIGDMFADAFKEDGSGTSCCGGTGDDCCR